MRAWGGQGPTRRVSTRCFPQSLWGDVRPRSVFLGLASFAGREQLVKRLRPIVTWLDRNFTLTLPIRFLGNVVKWGHSLNATRTLPSLGGGSVVA